MRTNVFKNELLDFASKLDAVTNSCGELVKIATAIVEEQNHTATISLVRTTCKLIDSECAKLEIKQFCNKPTRPFAE